MLGNKKLFSFLLILVLIFAMSPVSYADLFLKIDGVEGETLDQDHQKWITIESYDFEYSVVGSEASARSKGKLEKSPLTITKMLDKSTPALLQKLVGQEQLGDMEISLTLTSGDRTEILHLIFRNAQITSIVSSSKEGDIPMEDITFTYEGLVMNYMNGEGYFEE